MNQERAGYNAYFNGLERSQCPWTTDPYRREWLSGWDRAKREDRDIGSDWQ